MEEKIDKLLDQKRELVDKVVGSGEQWITELGSAELRELFSLSSGAAVADESDAEPVAAPVKKKRGRRAEVRA